MEIKLFDDDDNDDDDYYYYYYYYYWHETNPFYRQSEITVLISLQSKIWILLFKFVVYLAARVSTQNKPIHVVPYYSNVALVFESLGGILAQEYSNEISFFFPLDITPIIRTKLEAAPLTNALLQLQHQER